jgi:glycosyltransferase involved in cell wall biosynthesis
MTPRVTVLMTVYNGRGYLRTAIDSVLTQTFEDFELLIIDDCSTDDSAEIILAYDDSRIRLIRNERNLGQVASLNRGLGEARGEYVARLDQDDACLPERLARQVAYLDADHKLALVGTWMDVLDDNGELIWELRTEIDDPADCLFLVLTNQLPFAHPTVMFRLQAVRELDGYDVSVRFAEDQDLWRRLFLAGHSGAIVPQTLVHYLAHAGQQSQRHWEEQQVNNRRALERFVAELTGKSHARPIRLLLTWDYDFWRVYTTGAAAAETVRGLEVLLTSARNRFNLDASNAEKLERLIRARVALAARRSWRVGVRVHWRASRPLVRFGLEGVRGPYAAAAARFVYATAPLLVVVKLAEDTTRELVWTRPWFQSIKRRAKRIRSARRVYRLATRGRTTR